jgi:hypothetical protein
VSTWEIENTTNPNVHNTLTNTTYSYNPSGINVPISLNFGVNTVNTRDSSSTLASTNVTVSCAAGSSWNGSTCDAVPPSPPELNIDHGPNRELIRSGETVEVTIEVIAQYAAQCISRGERNSDCVYLQRYTHGFKYSYLTSRCGCLSTRDLI